MLDVFFIEIQHIHRRFLALKYSTALKLTTVLKLNTAPKHSTCALKQSIWRNFLLLRVKT
ncbi:hypothetical protein VA249_28630 [Vibrio alfacsensis]|nr:hypothetical protein VA249_28630 [Vibrio alfacsensis]